MGTRSTTKFIEKYTDNVTKTKKTQKLMAMYRQMDGYPEGHGKDLADFLKNGVLVNGYSMGEKRKKVFNGVGCMAAQVVKHFKKGTGNIHITTLSDKQEYNYEVIGDFDTKELTLIARDSNGRVLFNGHPKDYNAFLKRLKKEKENKG